MKKILLLAILAVSCQNLRFLCPSEMQQVEPKSYRVNEGSGYKECRQAALNSHFAKCRDLTDEELDNPDFEGAGYYDSKAAALAAPLVPLVTQYFENDDEWFLIDDDGNIYDNDGILV